VVVGCTDVRVCKLPFAKFGVVYGEVTWAANVSSRKRVPRRCDGPLEEHLGLLVGTGEQVNNVWFGLYEL